MRITYEQFSDRVWAAGFIPHECSYGHWHIVGGEYLVNFYPYGQNGQCFVVTGMKGVRGSLDEAIAAANKPKPLQQFGVADQRKRFQNKKGYRHRTKRMLLERDPHCKWCRCKLTFSTATLDHRIPLDKGGTNSQDNIVLACDPCNQAKGNSMPKSASA